MTSLVKTKEVRRRDWRMWCGIFAKVRERACNLRKARGSESISKENGDGRPWLLLFDNTKEEKEKALTVTRRTGMRRKEKPEAKQQEKKPLCFTFGAQPKTGQDPGNSRKGYTDSQVKRLRMSAPSQYTEWSRKKWGGQGKGWGREGVLSEGRNDKDGHITEEEAVSKRLCFVKVQVEFKAVSEQKLGRKNRQWKSESRRGEDLFSMKLGIVWKWSRERRKGRVKTFTTWKELKE